MCWFWCLKPVLTCSSGVKYPVSVARAGQSEHAEAGQVDGGGGPVNVATKNVDFYLSLLACASRRTLRAIRARSPRSRAVNASKNTDRT